MSRTIRRYKLCGYVLAFVVLAFIAPRALLAADKLVSLASIGPWPAISGLIGYGERIWFVNSVKFEDHNSADVYSLDPKTGWLRYERHLFSQDAGRPTLSNGLLYWPFEDGRFSMGRGEFMMTNGQDWHWQVIPKGQAFHVHAMHQHKQSLFAATGAFHAGLYRSDDRGLSWKMIFESADGEGSFSRLLSLASLGSDLYAGLYSSDENGIKLLRLAGAALKPVKGWPVGDTADGLAVFRNKLYALHTNAGTSEVWRTDGTQSEIVAGLKDVSVKALCAGVNALWAIGVDGKGGTLWKSLDGSAWHEVQRFEGDRPIDLTVFKDKPYVGMIGANGRGALWGPPLEMPVEIRLQRRVEPGPKLPVHKSGTGDLPKLLNDLDSTLVSSERLKPRGALRDITEPIVALRTPKAGAALAQRLGRVVKGLGRARFAGGSAALDQRSNWNLLWALARIGHGAVPLHLLSKPWQEKSHRSQKYAALPPAAAWTIGINEQNDAASIKALIARLDFAGDPLWLKGDIIGALTAITGQRFGYDFAGWKVWHKKRKSKQ